MVVPPCACVYRILNINTVLYVIAVSNLHGSLRLCYRRGMAAAGTALDLGCVLQALLLPSREDAEGSFTFLLLAASHSRAAPLSLCYVCSSLSIVSEFSREADNLS